MTYPPTSCGVNPKPGATIAVLAERCPAAFTTRLELAIGIHRALLSRCPDIPPKELRKALGAYCSHGAYLRSLVEGAPRIDLDGALAGVVTSDAARHAREFIAAREAAAIKQAAQAKSAVPQDGGKCGPWVAFESRSTIDIRREAPRPSEPPPQVHAGPRRLGISDLKAAALARRIGGAA